MIYVHKTFNMPSSNSSEITAMKQTAKYTA